MQLIQIEKTLDVEVVERQLAELWKQTSGERDTDNEAAVLRARVANLLVFVSTSELLDEVHQMLRELTGIHPSRVLMMVGPRSEPDRDIEMSLASIFQTDQRTGRERLCCESVTLKAQGSFAAELPSVALPLLIPDLTTFLWWRDAVQLSDKIFDTLLRATDRLVIDSAEFEDPGNDLVETDKLFVHDSCEDVGVSDLNWARLTFWRELLADFYDVPAYQPLLDNLDHVRIDYVGPEHQPTTLAPQALLIAGWLASRLGWNLRSDQTPGENDETLSFNFSTKNRSISPALERPAVPQSTVKEDVGDREIKVEFNRVERGERKPGRLVRVELRANADESASFTVTRSANNLHLSTEAKLGLQVHSGRVLPVRNRSAAQLLSREMEILCNDKIYQEALGLATALIESSTRSRLDRH